MGPVVDQAKQLETQWAKALIKMGNLHWLTQQEASVKATMNKDAYAVVTHAQTYQKYRQDATENDRHWMWKVDPAAAAADLTPNKFSDFWADVVAATCIPLATAGELGFAVEPVWARLGEMMGIMLGKFQGDVEKHSKTLCGLLRKYAAAVPGPTAKQWDLEGVRTLVSGDEVEGECQQLHFGSLASASTFGVVDNFPSELDVKLKIFGELSSES